jgi:sporulation protein YlmC with PRC-barrel domain
METSMNKAVLLAAALVLAPLTLSSQELRDKERETPPVGRSGGQAVPGERTDDQSRSALRDRVARAIEIVEDACAADIEDFCGKVTPGRSRLALCMLVHEDQLSNGCRSTLLGAARILKHKVDSVAEVCWNELQKLCGEADRIGQCLEQKRGSLSSTCQTIVEALAEKATHRLTALVGMPVYSADNKNLGRVVDVVKGSDDKLRSIQVDIGRTLGLGTKVVTIPAEKMERLPGIKLLLSDAEVRSLPEAKKQ